MSLYVNDENQPFDVPYHFVTGFDRNFLPVGYALVKSLSQHMSESYVFHVLCYDVFTYETLSRLDVPQVHLIQGEDFEKLHPELAPLKAHRSTAEYYWTCKSTLLRDIFEVLNDQQRLIFMDADHFFYDDPAPLFSELGEASIGMVEHQFGTRYAASEKNTGTYNAGFCIFRGDDRARRCLEWWRDQTLAWCSNFLEEGKFGDQMYLNHWPSMFEGTHVIQHPGAAVAPWNIQDRSPEQRGGRFLMNGKPLIFAHFHRFRTAGNNAFEPDASGTYQLSSSGVLKAYQVYARAVQQAADLMKDNVYAVDVAIVEKCSGAQLLKGLHQHKYFLTRPFVVGQLCWSMSGVFSVEESATLLDEATVAFQAGDIAVARQLARKSILRNPSRLFDRDIQYILFRTPEAL